MLTCSWPEARDQVIQSCDLLYPTSQQPRYSRREFKYLVWKVSFLRIAAMSTRLCPGVFHSPTPWVWAKANLSLRMEWGCGLRREVTMAKETAPQPGRALRAGESSLPCSIHFAAIIAHIYLKWLQIQRERKKKHTVNNNTNCHQWSEQCYKHLFDNRMSLLRNFPFSLPCVIGRDRGPVCSCPSLIREAWAGLSLLPSAPHILTAWPDNPEILTLLKLPTMKQPGPGGRGEWKKTTVQSDIFKETHCPHWPHLDESLCS